MSADPVFFGTVKTFAAQIQNADASNLVALYAPAASTKVEMLAVSSSDTGARDVSIAVTKGGVDYIVGTISVPITAGQIAATPAVDGLQLTASPFLRQDENGNRFLLLDTTCVLKAKALTTVTAGKVLQFFGHAREL